MFDWNDEEFSNILWDEAGGSDDHIVPYQDRSEDYRNKKEWNQEGVNSKPSEQKAVGGHGGKLESSSTSGNGVGSWSNLSLSNAPNAEQDSLGTQVSENLVGTTKYCSTSGEACRLDKDPDTFQDPHEGREQSDLVDYSWANIGSFDDLDRIFSNDDPIFGNVNLGSAEELWSSSKDVTNSLEKSFPTTADSSSLGLGVLRGTPESSQVKTNYEQQGNQSFTPSYGKVDDPVPYSLQKFESPSDRHRSFLREQTSTESGGTSCMSNPVHATEKLRNSELAADKVIIKKKLLNSRKRSEEIEANMLHDIYGTWPSGYPLGQYENQMESFMFNSPPSSDMKRQNQLQGTDTLQYQQFSTPFVAHSEHGNLRTQYPTMTFSSNNLPGEFIQRPSASSYNAPPSKANSINHSMKATPKLLTMTPQEKIDKLRRRQQMQALLAIQKQQKQFSHKVSCSDHSTTPKYDQENQLQCAEGTEVDDPCSIPSLDTLSPIEQDDSSTLSVAIDDNSLEETTLYRLHDIISKLDHRIRLSMRDSLFRLAQSAMQRQSSSDTCSPNKGIMDENEDATEETKNDNRMFDTETGTNSIDRTVAHLLFHRPQELSGKHSDMPGSPASAKFSGVPKAEDLMDFSMGGMPDSSNNPHQGPQNSGPLVEPLPDNQFEKSSCIDNSDNASNFGPAEGGITEFEASQ